MPVNQVSLTLPTHGIMEVRALGIHNKFKANGERARCHFFVFTNLFIFSDKQAEIGCSSTVNL